MPGWIRIPTGIIGKVTPTAALVYAVICDAGNMQPVQLSTAQIAQRSGCSERHARRCVDELITACYLSERLVSVGIRELIPAALMEPTRQHSTQKPVRGAKPIRRQPQQSSLPPIEELERMCNAGELMGKLTFTDDGDKEAVL